MKTVAVICEYNPFHRGHAALFARIRAQFGEDARIVCLMSGNFVQRGEPAVFDKFTRARAALTCGADLVLELPVTLALQSAEGFAGGVRLLAKLGVVDALAFGSECGDLAALLRVARAVETPEYAGALRGALDTGLSYPAARERALAALGGQTVILRAPNDILAVEYLRALHGTQIAPFAVPRIGGYHDLSTSAEFASAAAIRRAMAAGEDYLSLLPPEAADIFRDAPCYSLAAGERAMLAILRAMPDEAWQTLPYGGEGLRYRLRDACRTQTRYEEILTAAKTKRYPRTRLTRMLLLAYLGLTTEDLQREIPYLHVLGFTDAGREALHMAKAVGELPLVNAGVAGPDRPYVALERRCADLYTLFAEKPADMRCGTERKGRISYQKEKNACFSPDTVIK